MPYINPEADKLIDEAERTFDPAKQNEILARLHEIVVDDAPWIFVVHDQNPRALSPKVKGFVQPAELVRRPDRGRREVAPPLCGSSSALPILWGGSRGRISASVF